MFHHNQHNKNKARRLRINMTDAERKLWSGIRRKQLYDYQFLQQKIIGNCIVDFYCYAAKLILEVDGGQHYEEKGLKYAKKRSAYLRNLGFTVLRFSNIDVLTNVDAVAHTILDWLECCCKSDDMKSPQPPLQRGSYAVRCNDIYTADF
ncbi:endonuclease domain-containing protein [bacterium]|nr:endonuclease domain-containing protein [bacterium]